MRDFITILTSANNLPAAKKYEFDIEGNLKKTAYGNESLFHCELREVDSLNDIEVVLRELENELYKGVIRGIPKQNVSFPNYRRIHGENATFDSCEHHWVCCDFDGIPYEDYDVANDPILAIDYLKSWLPEEFHRECIYKFSSSQNVPPYRDGIAEKVLKAHLYFWLDEKVSDALLKAYFTYHDVPVDKSLFNPVQFHYTAKPIFIGMEDPISQRIGRC